MKRLWDPLGALNILHGLEFSLLSYYDSQGRPCIDRHHLEKVVRETRPSISLTDRLRYERIYASFSGARTTDFTPADSEFSRNRTALA